MKLNYDKKSKNPTYFIQQGIRNGKKTTTRNVKVIGKHNDLLKITDDPLQYAKDMVKAYNDDIKNNKIKINISIDFDKQLSSSDKISKSLNINIGYLYLQKIYHDLKIRDFFDDIVSRTKITYDVNEINRFVTFDRILEPRSKLGTFKHLDSYFEAPDIQYHNILKHHSLLAENFDDYIGHLFTNSNNIVKRDTSVCYFDCTNYYFEIEEPDEDDYDDVTGELISLGLRKYGISKQHQPAPLVQMGLFMDGAGIPISMCINPGNQNEQVCATATEEKMLRTFTNKKLIYCADAGLGSLDIRKFNSFGNRAFIVTQSIKKLSDTLKEAVFNDFEYKLLSNNKVISIEEMKSFDKKDKNNLNLYNDHAYKVIPADKLVDLGLEEIYTTKTGKTRKRKAKGTLNQYVIITFSRKMMEYQRKIRNKQIERAKKLIRNDRVEDLKKNQNDPKRFIMKAENKKDTYIINEELIKEEEKYDGYYAIATNLDAIKDAKEIFEINSQRYKIEDCFRVLKTYFKARPVNHRREDRIIGHFMVCYTALLIYRLLEVKLKQHNYHFTTGEIIENLKNMNVVNNHDIYYQSTYSGSELCNALNEVFGLELNKEYYQPKVLRKKIKKIL
ncbi:transposase [Erysipelatoclostridium sp. An173]|uniref:IS1634 family transposase n=1 Tax=Erysipelatoclostridium sp. An173 TaxID=1965571 RepID=UPI000B3AA342|nr:IS1634 family transposase [Erysipelatoclostridium sp. An173]OUP68999.1 transposase [Erysipelatoclostridium sp. An173]